MLVLCGTITRSTWVPGASLSFLFAYIGFLNAQDNFSESLIVTPRSYVLGNLQAKWWRKTTKKLYSKPFAEAENEAPGGLYSHDTKHYTSWQKRTLTASALFGSHGNAGSIKVCHRVMVQRVMVQFHNSPRMVLRSSVFNVKSSATF